MTGRCPIVTCRTLGCNWRGRPPSGAKGKARCPRCQRLFNPGRLNLKDGFKVALKRYFA